MRNSLKYWVTTDTHFGHQNLINEKIRPIDFEQRIISKLRVIGQNDILIHLGDIAWKDDKKHINNIISPLKCKKILVKGNHDKRGDLFYYINGFDFVCNSFNIDFNGKNIIFSHKPINIANDIDINIHGHFHIWDIDRWEPELKSIYTNKHVLVSLELNNYRPVLLNEILTKYIKKEKRNGK